VNREEERIGRLCRRRWGELLLVVIATPQTPHTRRDVNRCPGEVSSYQLLASEGLESGRLGEELGARRSSSTAAAQGATCRLGT
jgi:hypothetical protein